MGMWDGAGAEPSEVESGPLSPQGRSPTGRSGRRPVATARNEAVALVPDTAVRHLFGISVELAGVLELSRDPEVVRRIRQIISDADELIHEFRLASSEAQPVHSQLAAAAPPGDREAPAVTPDQPSDRRLASRLLQEASFAIDRSLTFTRRQSGRAAGDLEVDLEEASWAVHRAIIALTG
jgi:hypothetical protein